jgi:hypothetical protein
MTMAITIYRFQSATELASYLDKVLSETKNTLSLHLKETEDIRIRYEKNRKRNEAIKKLTGGKGEIATTKQLDFSGLRVLVNPTAEYELSLMENVIVSLQARIDAFQKIKDTVPTIDFEGMRVSLVLNDGIPTGFMLYMQD